MSKQILIKCYKYCCWIVSKKKFIKSLPVIELFFFHVCMCLQLKTTLAHQTLGTTNAHLVWMHLLIVKSPTAADVDREPVRLQRVTQIGDPDFRIFPHHHTKKSLRESAPEQRQSKAPLYTTANLNYWMNRSFLRNPKSRRLRCFLLV